MNLPLALTMGEPAGIGGEIALKAWLRRDEGVPPFYLIDDPGRLAALAARLGWNVPISRLAASRDAPAIFGEAPPYEDAFEALEAFMPTIAKGLARGERLHDYARHLLGLFAGRPGARFYRRALATEGVRADAGRDVLRAAIARIDRTEPREAAAA